MLFARGHADGESTRPSTPNQASNVAQQPSFQAIVRQPGLLLLDVNASTWFEYDRGDPTQFWLTNCTGSFGFRLRLDEGDPVPAEQTVDTIDEEVTSTPRLLKYDEVLQDESLLARPDLSMTWGSLSVYLSCYAS